MDKLIDDQRGAVQFSQNHFTNADKTAVYEVIHNIMAASENMGVKERDIERLTMILDNYQEQPHLLDHDIGDLVAELMNIVKCKSNPPDAVHLGFKYLYLLAKVRGPKYITRLFGHEVADLEPVLKMLMDQNPDDHDTWETRYILLLWLSIAAMIPFDMAKLDGMQTGDSQPKAKPIIDRILDTVKQYVCTRDASRDAAGLLIGKFMSRPDVKDQRLSEFISWCLEELSKNKEGESMKAMLPMIGILTTLASIFKHGRRESLLPFASDVQQTIVDCNILNLNNMLLRKLAVKVIQRIGLTFLKPRLASWRYQRGNRSLSHHLDNLKTTAVPDVKSRAQDEGEEDEEYDIPEAIEEVIELLLTGLKDKDTIVRWSAAKGVGRITGQLPKELADEVVGSLLEFFVLRESDTAWHGGCLALAELGRRGLLLPQRLPEVVPVVLKALIYDERRGACSVGSNVRDAACYVCWSFARAYDPQDLSPFVQKIASGLILTTIFDREVNCRRAASAAFQENVGRQGTFPHGIDILTTADYFAVGNRSHSYLELSVFVAQYKEYSRQLIDHLVEYKLSHWDCAVRELASKALHNLTPCDEQYMIESVLLRIMEYTKSIDLCTKHGNILAAAEVIHALSKLHSDEIGSIVSEEVQNQLNELVPKLTKEKQFRGYGGDFMRKAVCKFIEKLSLSKFPVKDDSVIFSWQDLIDDTLPHTEEEIREESVRAVTPLAVTYYQKADGSCQPYVKERIILKYLKKLKSSLHFDAIGFALGIGAFPKSLIAENLTEILNGLIEASTLKNDGKDGVFSEARRDALLALSRVCKTAGISSDGSQPGCLHVADINRVFEHYFLSMKDYTIDNRGDVGAWVREAAMSGLEVLTKQTVTSDPGLFTESICTSVFNNLLQQAFEKIDRTREHAGNILAKLLYLSPQIPNVLCHHELLSIFTSKYLNYLDWKAECQVFPTVIGLLPLQPYLYHVLIGLTVSAGGLSESLVHHASDALLKYISGLSHESDEYELFCRTVIEIFENNKRNERIVIPLFKVLDLLLGHGCFEKYTEVEDHPFSHKLFELMNNEILKCGNSKKLLASITVFCGLIQFPGTTRARALSRLLIFLCHKFPRIRKDTAEQLYLTFIGDNYSYSEEIMDKAIVILSETNWDSAVDKIRGERNKLCDLLGIKQPKPTNTGSKGNSADEKVDQLESYRDLVTRHDY